VVKGQLDGGIREKEQTARDDAGPVKVERTKYTYDFGAIAKAAQLQRGLGPSR